MADLTPDPDTPERPDDTARRLQALLLAHDVLALLTSAPPARYDGGSIEFLPKYAEWLARRDELLRKIESL